MNTNPRNKTNRKAAPLFILAILSLLLSFCASPQNPLEISPSPITSTKEILKQNTPRASEVIGVESTLPAQIKKIDNNMQQIADTVARDVGQVKYFNVGDPERMVFVFEETHNSPAGQTEIAIMLNRLYEDYGLRDIGLEGLFVDEGVLKPMVYDPTFQAKHPIRTPQDIVVGLLEEGEISSSEMMAMIYQDVNVRGIDDRQKYSVDTTETSGSAPVLYLFWIAAENKNITDQQAQEFKKIFDEDQKKGIEYLINLDPWAADIYKQIADETLILCEEEMLAILDKIEKKAAEVSAKNITESTKDMQDLKAFYQAAYDRSITMANTVTDLMNKGSVKASAMIIGAAHTCKITQLFREKGVSYAVLRGNTLENNTKHGDLSTAAIDRKYSILSVDPGGGLGSLLDNRKKFRPVVLTTWFKSKAAIYLLTDAFATAASLGEPVPFDKTLSSLPQLPEVQLDKQSIKVVDGPSGTKIVHFTILAKAENSSPVSIDVEARTVKPLSAKFLEQRLLESYSRLNAKPDEPSPELSLPVEVQISTEVKATFKLHMTTGS